MLLSSYRSVSRQTFPGNGCRVLHGPVRRYHPYFPTEGAAITTNATVNAAAGARSENKGRLTAIMNDAYLSHLRQIVDQVRADGFYKTERVVESPQSPQIRVNGTGGVLNLCANNYLGLADDPRLVKAASRRCSPRKMRSSAMN